MSSAPTEIAARIREFLHENFLYMRPNFVLNDQDRLLEKGVVDSMGILEVLQFIDDEFGVQPVDSEISEANLGSIEALAKFVASKQQSSAIA
jgi:acyl carrier protein